MALHQSELRLYTGVTLTPQHQRDFQSEGERTTYLSPFLHSTFSPFNIIKRSESGGTVQVSGVYSDFLGCNYLQIKNNPNGTAPARREFAYITNIEYVSKNTTEINFTMDHYQSSLFHFSIAESFVVRRHTKRWSSPGVPAINTVDEGLFAGNEREITLARNIAIDKVDDDTPFVYCIFQTTKDLSKIDGKGQLKGTTINNVFTQLNTYMVPIVLNGIQTQVRVDGSAIASMQTIFDIFTNDENFVNTLVNIMYTDTSPLMNTGSGYNLSFIGGYEIIGVQGDVMGKRLIRLGPGPAGMNQIPRIVSENVLNDLPNYSEPKLLFPPYTKFLLKEHTGEEVSFGLETALRARNSVSGALEIQRWGTFSDGGATVSTYLRDFSLDWDMNNPGKYGYIAKTQFTPPVITDFTAERMQSSRNSRLLAQATSAGQFIAGATLMATGAGTVVGAGMVAGAAMSVATQMGEYKDMENTADRATNGSDVYHEYGMTRTGLNFIVETLPLEHAQRLTEFFETYGYKINEMETPTTRVRQSWDYIQTDGCNVQGDITDFARQEIRTMYDNGLTLWHVNDICNYSLNNNER